MVVTTNGFVAQAPSGVNFTTSLGFQAMDYAVDKIFPVSQYRPSTLDTSNQELGHNIHQQSGLNNWNTLTFTGPLSMSAYRFRWFRYDDWNANILAYSGAGISVGSGLLGWMRGVEPIKYKYYDMIGSGNQVLTFVKSLCYPFDDISQVTGAWPITTSGAPELKFFTATNVSQYDFRDGPLLPSHQSTHLVETAQEHYNQMFIRPSANSNHPSFWRTRIFPNNTFGHLGVGAPLGVFSLSGIPIPSMSLSDTLALLDVPFRPTGWLTQESSISGMLRYGTVPGSSYRPLLQSINQISAPQTFVENICAVAYLDVAGNTANGSGVLQYAGGFPTLSTFQGMGVVPTKINYNVPSLDVATINLRFGYNFHNPVYLVRVSGSQSLNKEFDFTATDRFGNSRIVKYDIRPYWSNVQSSMTGIHAFQVPHNLAIAEWGYVTANFALQSYWQMVCTSGDILEGCTLNVNIPDNTLTLDPTQIFIDISGIRPQVKRITTEIFDPHFRTPPHPAFDYTLTSPRPTGQNFANLAPTGVPFYTTWAVNSGIIYGNFTNRVYHSGIYHAITAGQLATTFNTQPSLRNSKGEALLSQTNYISGIPNNAAQNQWSNHTQDFNLIIRPGNFNIANFNYYQGVSGSVRSHSVIFNSGSQSISTIPGIPVGTGEPFTLNNMTIELFVERRGHQGPCSGISTSVRVFDTNMVIANRWENLASPLWGTGAPINHSGPFTQVCNSWWSPA